MRVNPTAVERDAGVSAEAIFADAVDGSGGAGSVSMCCGTDRVR